MRVLTVTPHPAIDQTITLDVPLQPGQVHRVCHASSVQQHAGGKGINVALALALYGEPVAATGLLGRENDVPFADCFAHWGIADACIRTQGVTRVNTKIVCSQHTTDINTAAAPPTAAALEDLHQRITTHASSTTPWLALSGSLPPGCPADFYLRCLTATNPLGTRCVVDTSGAPLAAVLDVVQQNKNIPPPFAIKPNVHELAQYLGQPLETPTQALHAARALQQRTGITWLVVSLGSEGALVLHATQGGVHAQVAIDRPMHSTVGAGDFMVGGLLAAFLQEADLHTTARIASAFAAFRLTTTAQDWHSYILRDILADWMQRTRCTPL